MSFEDFKKSCQVTQDSVEEIEKRNIYPDDGRVPHVPFGFKNADWVEFKHQVQQGDDVYFFSTSRESWQNLAGRAGYVLVRGGEVVATFETMMN
jgi:hypothetical protein